MEECKHDEYCPLYLSYLGENLDELKYCKNSNNQNFYFSTNRIY
jgi:hypothetical protein